MIKQFNFRYLLSLLVVMFTIVSTLASAEQLKVILSENGYSPFSFTKNSPERGIFLDILDQISKITGDDFVINYYPAMRKRFVFAHGEADIEPGVNPVWRPNSSEVSLYSIPFGFATDVVFFRKDEAIDVETINDLTGKKVVTVRGYQYPSYEKAFDNHTIIRHDMNHELQLMRFLLQKNRGADAGFINKYILLYNMKEQNMVFDIGNVIGSVPIMFRFHISKKEALQRFNKALEQLTKDGTIDAIYKKYQ